MSKLKIAVSDSCPDCFTTQRECIYINESRNIDVAAIVLSLNDVTCGKLDEIDATGYGIPVFIATENQERVPAEYLPRISGVFENCESRREFYGRQFAQNTAHNFAGAGFRQGVGPVQHVWRRQRANRAMAGQYPHRTKLAISFTRALSSTRTPSFS